MAFHLQDIYLEKLLGSTPMENGEGNRRKQKESSCNVGLLEDHDETMSG